MMKNIKWSIQLYDKLAKLVKKGLSANQIAAELGMTKGMVIGKIHRSPSLQLAGNNYRSPTKSTKTKREKLKSNNSLLPMFPPPMPHIVAPTVVFTGNPVKFAQTNKFMCKYVVSGDKTEDFLFCGDRVYHRSFCKHHFDICYTASRYVNSAA